jgi:hypothetical protein
MKTRLAAAMAVLICGGAVAPGRCLAEDNSIVPPDDAFANGRPVRTMKTLNEIEPRIAIGKLPYVVTTSGSYFVTGNLSGVVARSGITIISSDVDLDLNGFTLYGVPASLDGVRVTADLVNVCIRNGVVRDWGRIGVNATNAYDVRLDNVRAFTNMIGGLSVGHDSLLTRCGAYKNVGDGIVVESGSTVRECKARGNSVVGINVRGACRVNGCVSIANWDSGFMAGDFSTVRDCTAAWNLRNGIVAQSGCRVEDNICGMNGRDLPEGSGIFVMGEGNRVADNSLTQNRRGIVAPGTGNLIIHNSVQGSMEDDYALNDGNMHGEILRDVTGGTTGFSNDNAWLNFVLPGGAGGR